MIQSGTVSGILT